MKLTLSEITFLTQIRFSETRFGSLSSNIKSNFVFSAGLSHPCTLGKSLFGEDTLIFHFLLAGSTAVATLGIRAPRPPNRLYEHLTISSLSALSSLTKTQQDENKILDPSLLDISSLWGRG